MFLYNFALKKPAVWTMDKLYIVETAGNKMGKCMHFCLVIVDTPSEDGSEKQKNKKGSDRMQPVLHNYGFSAREYHPRCLFRYNYRRFLVY